MKDEILKNTEDAKHNSCGRNGNLNINGNNFLMIENQDIVLIDHEGIDRS